jgi:hypothetical protein
MSYFIKYEQNTSSRPALPLQAMYFLYLVYLLPCGFAVVRQVFFFLVVCILTPCNSLDSNSRKVTACNSLDSQLISIPCNSFHNQLIFSVQLVR